MLELNKIYLKDCIKGMQLLPDDSIDIVIADPPYNLSKGGNWKWDNTTKLKGFGGKWEKAMENWDDMPLNEYFIFTINWLSEVKRVVKPTGSIWVHGTYHNIGIINFALQILETEIINEVIWYKRNSFPNLSGRRLTASHETILWAHTGDSKKRDYYFNYEMSKDHDYESDLIKQPSKQMRTVWDIPNNKKKEELAFGKHPTQKPERVIDRMIRISAKTGDTLLAPFSGAGTDCVVAKKLGLNYIGFELEEEYIKISEERLNNVEVGSIEMNKEHITEFSNPKEVPPSPLKKRGRPKKEVLDDLQISFNEITEDTEHQKVKPVKKKTEAIPSILKWTGSKRKQAKDIHSLFPAEYNRYIEPFLGGGALLYLAANEKSVANDIYTPVIEFWNLVKKDPERLINYYAEEWTKLQENFPDYFYEVRDRFNKNPNGFDLSFLTRTCVNGIVRFNKEGEFNNSLHLSRRGMKPNKFEKIVYQWNSKIQGVEFYNKDYREVLELAENGDLIYLDPPYAGSSNRYISNLEIQPFFEELEKLNRKGVKWMLSFDGQRGDTNLEYPVPIDLFQNKYLLSNGASTLNQVLNGQSKEVKETLYTNF